MGDIGIVHRLRGRRSNRAVDDTFRCAVIELYRKEYSPDFGPTLASEKLCERGYEVSVSTLRRWLVEEGLWEEKRRRQKHRCRRHRRDCLGELVQADGSHHDWLEGRGEDTIQRTLSRVFADTLGANGGPAPGPLEFIALPDTSSTT
jgi:hypothetical protein